MTDREARRQARARHGRPTASAAQLRCFVLRALVALSTTISAAYLLVSVWVVFAWGPVENVTTADWGEVLWLTVFVFVPWFVGVIWLAAWLGRPVETLQGMADSIMEASRRERQRSLG